MYFSLKKEFFLRKLIFLLLAATLFLSCASPRYQHLRGGTAPSSGHQSNRYAGLEAEAHHSVQQREARENVQRTGNHEMRGEASWYGPGYHGRTTASGEKFNQNAMTAAHKTLPFNTNVRVTDLATGKSVVVRINDRGPYAKGRIIDLSKRAAERLGMRERGHAQVKLEIVRR